MSVSKQLSNFLTAKARLGLFSRAFLFMTLLMVISLAIWLYIADKAQINNQAELLADRANTSFKIAQKALAFVSPSKRHSLVIQLATPGDSLIYPRTIEDKYTPLEQTEFNQLFKEKLLGKYQPFQNQILASRVNDIPGLWISMEVDDDLYWLYIPTNTYTKSSPLDEGFRWLLIALCIAVLGSALIMNSIVQPLNKLSRNITMLSQGRTPPDLPTQSGSPEIVHLFALINDMVHNLKQADADREIMLAGISHDVRTPLARIRLEIELSPMSEESRMAIDSDITQIEHCINQLIVYARSMGESIYEPTNVSDHLEELCQKLKPHLAHEQTQFDYTIEKNLFAKIKDVDLYRMVENLIENARRYGRDKQGQLHICVNLYSSSGMIYIDVADQGRGVDPKTVNRLLRPFTRGTTARSDASGAGLGLAIVKRLLLHVDGNLLLLPNTPQGLLCRIEIPKFSDSKI